MQVNKPTTLATKLPENSPTKAANYRRRRRLPVIAGSPNGHWTIECARVTCLTSESEGPSDSIWGRPSGAQPRPAEECAEINGPMPNRQSRGTSNDQPARDARLKRRATRTATQDSTIDEQEPTLPPTDSAALSTSNLRLSECLHGCEEIIRQGQNAWQSISAAIMEIRDQRLYRAEGFTDFGVYCKERLHFGKTPITRHIAVGEVLHALASTGAEMLPSSERQLRPLLFLRKPAQDPAVWGKTVAKVWAKVVDHANISRETITQKSVIRALEELGHEPAPKKPHPEFALEERWAHLEAQLEHETEFWPPDKQGELCPRLSAWLSDWENRNAHRSAVNEAPAPKPDTVNVEHPKTHRRAVRGKLDPKEKANILAALMEAKPL